MNFSYGKILNLLINFINMKRRTNGLYLLSYEAYWHAKGGYGDVRIQRMQKRKQIRKDKRVLKKSRRPRYCSCCGQYIEDDYVCGYG